jgi:hypothetical protein
MRKRILIGIGLVMASVIVVASVASAQGALTLSANPMKLTYGKDVKLTVGFPDTVPATATILAMPAGDSVWTTTTLQATTAIPTVTVKKPKATTTYQAWISDETSSNPVTVEVMARLTKPKINGYVHRGHLYTVKGTMRPQEASTVTVSFWRLETTIVVKKNGIGHLRRIAVDKWVMHSSVEVGLHRLNSQWSKWSTKWRPDASGSWLIMVTHEDVSHVKSFAKTFKWVRL